jgi:signal transduction histidine kinase
MHLLSVRESYRELQDKNTSLQQAFDRLKELDRLKSNFLATVSHELRTPLTSIIGYSEMLKEGLAGGLSSEQTEYVTTIFEKGNQLLELITGLLDLSKLESGTLQMRSSEVDLSRLIDDVLSTLTPPRSSASSTDQSDSRHGTSTTADSRRAWSSRRPWPGSRWISW